MSALTVSSSAWDSCPIWPTPVAGPLGPADDDAAARRRGRAESLATLTRISHEMFVDDETGRLLEGAASELNGADPTTTTPRLVTLMRRQWEKARRVPPDLAAELARAASVGQEAWIVARERGRTSRASRPTSSATSSSRAAMSSATGQRRLRVRLRRAARRLRAPAANTGRWRTLFAELKAELVPMIARVSRGRAGRRGPLYGHFPVDRQRALVAEVVALMGFDRAGLADRRHRAPVRHPDRRVATFASPPAGTSAFFPTGLYGAMHECGHGLYEAGLAGELRRSRIGSTESLGMHESQSRLWENMVGRGRPSAPCWRRGSPRWRAASCPVSTPDALYRAVNRIKPIVHTRRGRRGHLRAAHHPALRARAGADRGHARRPDLPEAWNARFEEYLGFRSPMTSRACSRTSTGRRD